MNVRAARIATIAGGVVVAVSLAASQAVGAATPPGAGHQGKLPGTVHGHALIVTQQSGHAGPARAVPPLAAAIHGHNAAGQPLTASASPAGYSPARLQAYLGLHGDGSGQTVAIVDAFDDPTITSDVNTYSQQFGLPLVCGTAGAGSDCFHFTVKAPDGTAGTDSAWGLEMSLDVEMVHAVAPGATVVLIEGHDSSVQALDTAIGHAANLDPVTISNSWTLSGLEFTGETALDSDCELAHSLCVFSAGDFGNPTGYPATNPYVLSVGGTTLNLNSDGSVASETAWSIPLHGTGSGGGGLSYIEPRPSYQRKVNPSPYRGVPDVSFDADPSTGVAVYDSDGIAGQWIEVGGTSVGAPAWSAILAVAGQLRAAAGKPPLAGAHFAAQRAVYRLHTGLADITQGDNGSNEGETQSSDWYGVRCGPQCLAGPGYDYVTGLGSPRPGIDTALTAAP